MNIQNHRGFLEACAVAFGVLAVYLLTLPPTVTGEDSGELIAAAYTLGVAHPPGYPIWCILAHIFTYIPLFSVAWRVAFMSAVFGAATVALLYLILKHLTGHRWLCAAAAMGFGFSSEFWEQALIAEVYTLNAFFIALCILLLLHWQATRDDRFLYAFAVTYGLSLCNHTTMQLLGPVFVVFVLLVDPYFWRRFKVYARCTLLAMACLALYAYLPLRSMSDPPVDWGNPENWDNFYAHVTRAQYSFALEENGRSVTRFGLQMLEFLKLYLWEYSPWLCWLPLLGIVPLWKRDRRAFALVALIFLACSVGLIYILNFSIDRTSLWLNNVFWIPAYMMVAISMGTGLAAVWDRSRRGLRATTAALAAILAISPLALHFAPNDKSDYYWTRDLAMNLFNAMDENAIYFPTADHATFPLLYFQAVEGVRPDVTIANVYGYPEESVYADMPESLRANFSQVPTASQQHFIEDWVIRNTDRPVYFSQHRPAPRDLPGAEIRMAGLLYRVVRPGEAWAEEGEWDAMVWHTLDAADAHDELTATMILSDIHFAEGRRLLAQREAEAGFAAFDRAVEVAGRDKSTYNNLGSAAVELGYRDEGAGYYLAALAIDPEYPLPRRNMAKLFLREGDFVNALKQFRAIADADPQNPDTYFDVVECLTKLQRPDEAISVLRAVENRFGKHPRIYRELGYVYLNEKYNSATAEYYFTQSLLLDKNQPDLRSIIGRDPTPEDLQRYYPPGTEIPEEFQKPDVPMPYVPGGPSRPTVDLPKPPVPTTGPAPTPDLTGPPITGNSPATGPAIVPGATPPSPAGPPVPVNLP